jgi:glucokinase
MHATQGVGVSVMFPVLLADIGGSNSRFALFDRPGRLTDIVSIANDTVPDLETAIDGYLARTGVCPPRAVLAVAGPVDGERIALTNRPWTWRRSDLAARFGLSDLRVVNDFEAIAWAVPRFAATDLRPLGWPAPSRAGVRLVIGPGTGLGIAALAPIDGSFHVLPSEGGHSAFGPRASDEVAVFTSLMRRHGDVCAETVLSGPGLARLYQALDAHAESLSPEAIVAGALAGEPHAQATARLFVRMLGRFAGSMALTFKALGGVYIVGGIARSLAALLDESQFRASFEAHPPYEEMLARIPTWLVTCAEPGLAGCAALAELCDQQIAAR